VGNDGHVTDVVGIVHETTDLNGLLDWFFRSLISPSVCGQSVPPRPWS